MINRKIYLSEVVSVLNINESIKKDFLFDGISTIEKASNNTIIFIKKISDDYTDRILSLNNCLIITQDKNEYPFLNLKVNNSRLAMAKILNYIEARSKVNKTMLSKKAIISPNSVIGEGVVIEDLVYIGPGVEIGNNTVIKQGVKILSNTKIGDNCVIRENSVVGGQGFGVEKDENGKNLKISHLGGVIISDFVEVGALNTVVSGTINPTIIEEYVKIDDHVHIAHNCHIKRNSIITAGVILSGSVTIGENVWIGPNSTIKNSLKVENNNLIGIGTVITKNILGENNTYAGVPGKEFNSYINEKKAVQFLIENIDIIKDKL